LGDYSHKKPYNWPNYLGQVKWLDHELGKLLNKGGKKIVAPSPDIEDIIDARALLKTLPERMVKAGIIRDEGGKLNNADKLYLCRQRHRISKFNWADAEKIERMRQLYVEEELSCAEVGKIVRKSRSAVQRQLNKLGVIRR